MKSHRRNLPLHRNNWLTKPARHLTCPRCAKRWPRPSRKPSRPLTPSPPTLSRNRVSTPPQRKRPRILLKSFRDYIEQHKAEITALQILYSRPYKQRLTEQMLKELEKKLRDNHAAWTEDRLWDALRCGQARQGQRPLAGRTLRRPRRPRPLRAGTTARARALRRFGVRTVQRMAHGQSQSCLSTLDPQLSTSCSVLHPGAARLAQPHPRSHRHQPPALTPGISIMLRSVQRGGLGRAHQLFGNDLNRILDELNLRLVA